MRKNCFKILLKFQSINQLDQLKIINFTLTWSNEGKMKSVRPGVTYSEELQQKMKMLDKPMLKNI